MRFVVGKGGVGKTTVAAATAVSLARRGSRVLLVSLDQAHSVAEVIGAPRRPGTSDALAAIDGTDRDGGGLEILELDTLALLEHRLAGAAALVPGGPEHDHSLSVPDPEELTALPGAQELAGLVEVTRLADSGDWDDLVVDCPATADSLRLLTVPDLVADTVERIWPQHQRVTLGQGTTQWHLLAAMMIDRLVASTAPVRALLGDPARTGVRLVVGPTVVAVAEAKRTVTALALIGVALDDVVVNGLLPQDDSIRDDGSAAPALHWYVRRAAAQRAIVADLSATLPAVPVHVAHDRGDEPVGLSILDALADDVAQSGAVTAPGADEPESAASRHVPAVEHESGAGVDSVYALRIPLPLVDPATITLGRVGDDLLIGAAGVRRRMTLASVLRRCVTVGAGLEGDDLVVRFRPDPEVWPQ
ncbi:ArsA family ATPase [Rhodococcus sp. NPDC003318]|uniref:ArsA family ATPase n=1 Tax=Rhodococcus sp. NPDC003318 TaxID=3364503 RepID=UPI00368D2248